MARLIDADELRHEFYNNTDYGHYAMCMDGSEVEFTMNEVFRIIDNAPTIEAEPVKHGKWSGRYNSHCSNCGCFCTLAYIKDYPDFCPNCGARMDGE